MRFRVKHILLVASPYDAYVLEEDGKLTDLIYNEYLELNLTVSPNVRRAINAQEALEILYSHEIDMVLIFKRVSDINVVAFGREVKNLYPNLPVILLAYHERELETMLAQKNGRAIDDIFVWTGDAKILLSIIKLVEDRFNVDSDTEAVGVRVIIIVEDSVKFYSSYLPLLYGELMRQTRALMAEGLNISDKILRMRTRPKILLTHNYEQAVEMFRKYHDYLLALITDFSFDVAGKEQDDAGLRLVELVRTEIPDLPVLMQSSDERNADIAAHYKAGFLSKRSKTLHAELSNFVITHFGFGDFVFTDPDTGAPIATAGDFKTLEKCIQDIDERSLIYHANRNHFSNWLMARTEFDLASKIRPIRVSEFNDTTSLKRYLIDTIREFRHEKQEGVISDFSRKQFDLQSDFARIGGGSLGGKGRGLAFINAMLSQRYLYNRFPDVQITVPTSVIVGTDVFDDFLRKNDLLRFALGDRSDSELITAFLKGHFPKEILSDLDALLSVMKYPIAVRSSSMLEDSHLQTFAGVYDTHMLPNNHSGRKVRRQQLEDTIKMIYASTYLKNSKAYHEASGNRVEEEKMAVIIQQAVGRQYEHVFYPSFSGVALSYNFYSVDHSGAEDGVVYVALGFGKTIVEGMNCLRFSPSGPDKLPQFSTVKDMLKNSQHEFFAIDLSHPAAPLKHDVYDGLIRLPVTHAETDGTLAPICSTYSAENNRIYDGSSQKGSRIITFAPILKSRTFPLPQITKFLLELGGEGLNCPVEIEFAVSLDRDKSDVDRFYFLQIRPMIKEALFETVDLSTVPQHQVVSRSEKTLGNMRTDNISDIIFVPPETFDRNKTVEIAGQVGEFNQRMKEQHRRYLLIGPGRWGTTERWLGIPVTWKQISEAKVIMEAAYGDFAPDPSFGTHFFQNLTSFQIGYFTVNPNKGNGFVDFDWLLSQPIRDSTPFVAHIQLERPLVILIDGRLGHGVIARQG